MKASLIYPRYPQYQPTANPYHASVMPAATISIKTPGSENVAPGGRHSARVKIETPPESRAKSESPITTALAKRNANIQSPAKLVAGPTGIKCSGGEGEAADFRFVKAESQDDVRSSPSKSSTSSPTKGLLSKGNLLKL